mgnify:CR=1 FL=1
MSDIMERFQERAEAVSAQVTHVQGPQEAFEYTLRLCVQKEACQILVSGCEQPLSTAAEDLCHLQVPEKTIAAPDFSSSQLQSLVDLCKEQSISVIQQGLREYLGGMDIGLTQADYAVAETGTLVLDSSKEDFRLATMIPEIHVVLLYSSHIVSDFPQIKNYLQQRFSSTANYTAFITGPSRTADIERVLTLGVHGPLEQHIIIVNDCSNKGQL